MRCLVLTALVAAFLLAAPSLSVGQVAALEARVATLETP